MEFGNEEIPECNSSLQSIGFTGMTQQVKYGEAILQILCTSREFV
jgi:hypothetical protein